MAIPSGYTPLDFVGFTDKGTYANNVLYVKNDLVHYGGDIWKCKVDNTTGVVPADGVNWEIFMGAPTNLVERIIAPLETNPATVAYAIGRQIIYDDWLWEVIAPIAIGDTLIDYAVDPSNANIKKAPAVETQLLALSSKAYQTDDATETSIADDDLLPFYDTSATAKKKSTWSNIIAKIKEKLGTAATKDFTTSVTSGSANLVTSGAVYSQIQTLANSIAPTENGTNYSKTYYKDDEFYRNGVLYKVTASSVNSSTAINTGNGGNATASDSIAEQIKPIKGNWVMESDSNILTLATADGTKTLSTLISEANTAFHNVNIPSGYAYEARQLVVPHLNNSTATYSLSALLTADVLHVNSWSNFSLQASRIMLGTNEMLLVDCGLPWGEYVETSIKSNGTVTYTDLTSVVPANGAVIQVRYSKWKKI